ncbi:MAG: hypothetical protein HQ572_05235 [Candidatus Omnitrophica bacterium]|nr:hypothetical protein [Candidatus Omnitrophota bacterium]
MRRYYFLLPFIAGLLICSFCLLARAESWANDDYLSLESYEHPYRYFSQTTQLTKKPTNPIEHNLFRLGEEFVAGFNAIYQDDIEKAIEHLKQARRIVPEYLHVDIIIAILLEEKGEVAMAAQFYKSYLLKLQKLEKGFYPIAQKFIVGTVNFSMPGYNDAKETIAAKLSAAGVDIEKISPYKEQSRLVYLLLAVAFLFIIYLIARIPTIRQFFYRLKADLNRDKEIWICIFCGRENANINSSCYNCEKSR